MMEEVSEMTRRDPTGSVWEDGEVGGDVLGESLRSFREMRTVEVQKRVRQGNGPYG